MVGYNNSMILRNIEQGLFSWLDKKKILIIKGPRQVGKTTLIKKIQKQLEEQKHKVFYFSMDRYDHLERAQDPLLFYEYLKDLGLDPKQRNYLFIDEFQYITEAGRFLKILFDEYKDHLQIVATGSSSLEITKNSEFLTGRKIDFQMRSVSFFELFRYRELNNDFELIDIKDKARIEAFYQNHKARLEFHFFDYLKFGGYPEVLLEDKVANKKEIIREITNTYLKKDIAAFMKVSDIMAFNDLIQLLASQIGNLVNLSELSNTLGLNRATLDRYMDILQGTYVFDLLRPYASNQRKVISKTPKVYIQDFGLQKVSLNYFPQDTNLIAGVEVENFVYQLLSANIHDQLYFYRTSAGAEIDFLALTEGGVDLIEVKYSSKVNTRTKMPSNMIHFLADHSQLGSRHKIMVTKDYLSLDYQKQEFFIPACLLALVDLND